MKIWFNPVFSGNVPKHGNGMQLQLVFIYSISFLDLSNDVLLKCYFWSYSSHNAYQISRLIASPKPQLVIVILPRDRDLHSKCISKTLSKYLCYEIPKSCFLASQDRLNYYVTRIVSQCCKD